MRIRIVTPARAGSRRGNRITADRWAKILRSLGHRVLVEESLSGGPCDLLVALHARRSAASVRRSRRDDPRRPIVLALTGTDLYGDIRRPGPARRTLALADLLVVLQPLAVRELPRRLRRRVRVVYQSQSQSIKGLRPRPAPPRDRFQVCVLGHLRAVKDPFRTAMAVRRLPARSRVRVVHAGAALDASMAPRARAEEARNPRYRWVGDLSRPRALRLLASSRLLVLSSRQEGGANVIGEAAVLGVPVLSTRIPGSVGLLGERYPGYFAVGDTRALAALVSRAEEDPAFHARLRRACEGRARLFAPALERATWRRLLRELMRPGVRRGSSPPAR